MNGHGLEAARSALPSLRVVNVRRVQRLWVRTRTLLLVVGDVGAAVWAISLAESSRSVVGLADLPVGVSSAGSASISYEWFSLGTVAVWLALLVMTGAYAGTKRWSLWEQAAATWRAGVGALAVIGVVSMFARLQLSRAFVLTTLIALIALTTSARAVVLAVFRGLMHLGIQADRVFLVGPTGAVSDLETHLRRTSRHVRVVGSLDPGGRTVDAMVAELRRSIAQQGITSVIATDNAIPSGGARELAGALRDLGVTTLVAPGTREVLGPSLHLHAVGDLFLLRVGSGHQSRIACSAKAGLDRFGALVGIIVLAPLLTLIAVLIRRDGGPAIFRQERVGRNGRRFRIMKFRTMCINAEERLRTDGLYDTYVANGFKLPPELDPRITRIGRWLRRTSLDELPQLFNVLGGSMSLVGPRPIVPDELGSYGDLRSAYLNLKPGVTGYWQANGRSDVAFPERAVLDSYYYDHQSLRLDIRILARTVMAVLARRGAQ